MDTTQASSVSTAEMLTPAKLTLTERLFSNALKRLSGGRLHLSFPSGAELIVGQGATTESMEIRDRAFFRKVLAGGSVAFGEAYVEGLVVEFLM